MSAISQPAVTHRSIETNGIRMHIAEQGTGPAVILLHGFPESWYSWRHQLSLLADAGYQLSLRTSADLGAPIRQKR